MFERIPEKEIMDDKEQAEAYSNADFSEPHNLFIDLASKLVESQSYKTVLDIGIGDGDIAIRLIKKFPAMNVTGFDGSLAMLGYAKEKIQASGLSERIFCHHDLIENKPFAKKKFDLVISNSVLHHVKSPNLFWLLVKGRMNENGKFFIMDLLRPESIEGAQNLVNKYANNETEQLKKDFYNSLLAAYTSNEIKDQLKENNLVGCNVEQITDRHFVVFGGMFA